jgi:adenine-specific DNA-methyltransferase
MGDKPSRPPRVELSSPDLKTELLTRLRSAAPEVFTEGDLDLEKLRELAGASVANGPERFSLNWAGKRDAIAML